MELTQAYLKSILNYCPETGVFTWLPRPESAFKRIRLCRAWNTRWEGTVAGHTESQGYWVIKVDGEQYKAHRLAWLYMTGMWPKDEIDHIDGEKANNRFSNLREANRAQNNSNTPARKTNTSGNKGVYLANRKRPWQASIMAMGKRVHLGGFETKELAYAAYCKAADKLHGDFANY